MNRTIINFVVDLTAAALFLGMIATGYVLGFSLPPGSNKIWSLWGLTRHQWGTVHFWISWGFLGAILLHVCLHWQWIVSVVRKRLGLAAALPGSLLRSGLATLAMVSAVLALFAWATHQGVRAITDPESFDVCPPATGGVGKPIDAVGSTPPLIPRQENRTPVAFWKDVYPVLERSCLSCHGPKRQKGDFRVDRREDFFATEGKAALVVPGKSAESLLIAIVSGRKADIPRPEVHRLPEADVALFGAWIDAGASWPQRPDRE